LATAATIALLLVILVADALILGANTAARRGLAIACAFTVGAPAAIAVVVFVALGRAGPEDWMALGVMTFAWAAAVLSAAATLVWVRARSGRFSTQFAATFAALLTASVVWGLLGFIVMWGASESSK